MTIGSTVLPRYAEGRPSFGLSGKSLCIASKAQLAILNPQSLTRGQRLLIGEYVGS